MSDQEDIYRLRLKALMLERSNLDDQFQDRKVELIKREDVAVASDQRLGMFLLDLQSRTIPFYDFALFIVLSLFMAGSPKAPKGGRIFSACVGRTTREKRKDNT